MTSLSKKNSVSVLECTNCCIALEDFKKCSGCAAAFYCSRACQVQDWKKGGHSKTCISVKPANPVVFTETRKGLNTCVFCLGECDASHRVSHASGSCIFYVDPLCLQNLHGRTKCPLCNECDGMFYYLSHFTNEKCHQDYKHYGKLALDEFKKAGNYASPQHVIGVCQASLVYMNARPVHDECRRQTKNLNAYLNIAAAYSELKNEGMFDRFIRKAREIDSSPLGPSFIVETTSLLFFEKWDVAEIELGKIVKMFPTFKIMTSMYAYSLYQLGVVGKANCIYEDVFHHKPDSVASYPKWTEYNFANGTTVFQLPLNEFISFAAGALLEQYYLLKEKKALFCHIPELNLLRESFTFSLTIKIITEKTLRGFPIKVVLKSS